MNIPEHGRATDQWGRVSDDGSVFVKTSEGERKVGQWPDGDPVEALAFFEKRFESLTFEVDLLEQRVKAGTVPPDEAAASVKTLRSGIDSVQAVGDIEGLKQRLGKVTETINERRAQRKLERAKKLEVAKAAKEEIIERAERLAEGGDWRNGANKLRELLDEWKAVVRLDKADDDALWRRFSAARTTYTRRRKTHFAEQSELRDSAKSVKEKLVVKAESLAGSTDWGATAGAYRDLMSQWKAAGPAPKGVDDRLWKRFRAAQDTFFGARDAANAQVDAEFAANAEKKQAVLVEAESLLPVQNPKAAKEAFRELAERWDAAGKVPRDRIKDLEGRFRKVEQTVRGAEEDQWSRSNPEARARAADAVAQLESAIADLTLKQEKAAAAGNTRKAAEYADALDARTSWLIEAQKALAEFSG